jgi:hypothetical protein
LWHHTDRGASPGGRGVQHEETTMALRFQKRIRIFPGLWLNLSKTGISFSVGGNGATMNVGTRSRTFTVGIPGTGLSYRVPLTSIILLGILGVIVVLALIWMIAPDLIRPWLHAWQPKIF